MRPVDQHEALGLICKGEGCWGIFLSVGWRGGAPPTDAGDWLDHLYRAAPVLSRQECAQIAADGEGFLLFETETEMLAVFGSIVGDDGPPRRTRTTARAGCTRLPLALMDVYAAKTRRLRTASYAALREEPGGCACNRPRPPAHAPANVQEGKNPVG